MWSSRPLLSPRCVDGIECARRRTEGSERVQVCRKKKKKITRGDPTLLLLPPLFDTLRGTGLRSRRPLSGLLHLFFKLTHRNLRKTTPSKPEHTHTFLSEKTTRRSTLAAGAAIASALAAALVPASPAQAFLGFGGASKDEEYATDTVSSSLKQQRAGGGERRRGRREGEEREISLSLSPARSLRFLCSSSSSASSSSTSSTSSPSFFFPSHPKFSKTEPSASPPQAGVIATVRTAVTLGRDDPGREAAVAAVRQATNSWVAKYRRDNQFSGKPSYG